MDNPRHRRRIARSDTTLIVAFPHHVGGSLMTLSQQAAELFLLGLPIASIAWTVTHEDLFREPRAWCAERSRTSQRLSARKFFYLFTCEYCFSHYVTIFFLFVTHFTILFDDWRGYLIAGFSLVWIANVYMSLFGRLRLEIREDRIAVASAESAAPPGTPPIR